jgi:hypothetical protein
MTDSIIPKGTRQNVAVGPELTFFIGNAVGMAVDAVLPGDWNPLENGPVQIYGVMDFLWQTDGGKFVFIPSTQFRLLPKFWLHPFIQVGYTLPENGSGVKEQLLTTFGALIELGKKQ